MRAGPALVALLALGCGRSGAPAAGDDRTGLLHAAWTPTEVELGAVHVTVEVPAGLPRNDEYALGVDWWINAHRDVSDLASGPRLTLDTPRGDAPADVAALAHRTDGDLGGADRQVLVSERGADGRLRYAQSWNGHRHLALSVWIPLADGRGLACHGEWYRRSERELTLDPALLPWLERFCASVRAR